MKKKIKKNKRTNYLQKNIAPFKLQRKTRYKMSYDLF